MKETTLIFPIRKDAGEIVLAMKKTGFGEGRYNGVGGKIEAGEAVRDAAVREAQEEIGIEISPDDLLPVADITFSFEANPGWDIHCYIFLAYQWKGEPSESDEMSPRVYPLSAVPYEQMWIDDKEWLPAVLEGKKIKAAVQFNSDGSILLGTDIEEADMLSF